MSPSFTLRYSEASDPELLAELERVLRRRRRTDLSPATYFVRCMDRAIQNRRTVKRWQSRRRWTASS